jgi:hypothetical protein
MVPHDFRMVVVIVFPFFARFFGPEKFTSIHVIHNLINIQISNLWFCPNRRPLTLDYFMPNLAQYERISDCDNQHGARVEQRHIGQLPRLDAQYRPGLKSKFKHLLTSCQGLINGRIDREWERFSRTWWKKCHAKSKGPSLFILAINWS